MECGSFKSLLLHLIGRSIVCVCVSLPWRLWWDRHHHRVWVKRALALLHSLPPPPPPHRATKEKPKTAKYILTMAKTSSSTHIFPLALLFTASNSPTHICVCCVHRYGGGVGFKLQSNGALRDPLLFDSNFVRQNVLVAITFFKGPSFPIPVDW